MRVVRPLAQVLAFSLELVMLAAFGAWGFGLHQAVALRWAVGLGAPSLAIVVWGLLLAPRARRRLGPVGVAALSLGLFELAALALVRSGRGGLGAALAVVAVVSVALSYVIRRAEER